MYSVGISKGGADAPAEPVLMGLDLNGVAALTAFHEILAGLIRAGYIVTRWPGVVVYEASRLDEYLVLFMVEEPYSMN